MSSSKFLNFSPGVSIACMAKRIMTTILLSRRFQIKFPGARIQLTRTLDLGGLVISVGASACKYHGTREVRPAPVWASCRCGYHDMDVI
ncbi:hypothetical protein BDW72DRAFT_182643 [Aspergillus terricola var. indicus]